MDSPMINMRYILEKEGMGIYMDLCFRRILNENLIDEKTVFINLEDTKDLVFTIDGMEKCSSILEGYIGKEQVSIYIRQMKESEHVLEIALKEATLFRLTPKRILRRIAKGENAAGLPQDTMIWLQLFAKEELRARRLTAVIKRKSAYLHKKLNFMWRYRRLYFLSLLRPDLFQDSETTS